MAGLTSDGLTIKRYPEIIEDLETSEQQNISPTIETNDDSVLGQINAILATALSELWELAESVNSNFDKDKAEGKNLDDLGSLIGVSRIDAEKTSGDLTVVAKDGVVINQGSVFKSNTTGNRFFAKETNIVSSTLCTSATFIVSQVLNSTLYTITINGNTYTYSSDISATANEIVTGLKASIDADTTKTWTATLSTDNLIITTLDTKEISVTSDSYLSVASVTKKIVIEAETTGKIIVPANTVTVLVSPISNITSLTNELDLIVGRDKESDEDFRERFTLSGGVNGKSTLPAIRAQLLSTDGVFSVTVVDNDTTVTSVDGLPPKSFESIVQGGTDQDVATTIWDNKPAGIETYGLTSTIITDSNGDQRTVKYTRPSIVNLAVRVTYTTYDEETYPDNGDELIASIVLNHINNLGADVDVIPHRLFGPIFSGVSGIGTLVVEIQTLTNPGDPPVGGSWQTTAIPISIRQFSQTTLVDITIVGP